MSGACPLVDHAPERSPRGGVPGTELAKVCFACTPLATRVVPGACLLACLLVASAKTERRSLANPVVPGSMTALSRSHRDAEIPKCPARATCQSALPRWRSQRAATPERPPAGHLSAGQNTLCPSLVDRCRQGTATPKRPPEATARRANVSHGWATSR